MIAIDDMIGADDDTRLDYAVSIANQIARPKNGTVSVTFGARDYVFHRPIEIAGHIQLLGREAGSRSTGFYFANPKNDQTLVKYRQANAAGIKNIWIKGASTGASNVTGLLVSDCGRSQFHNISIEISNIGKDTTGMVHERGAGRTGVGRGEKNHIAHGVIEASMPFVPKSGDNCKFEDFQLTCLGDISADRVSAAIQGRDKTTYDHWHFEDISAQRGDHMFYTRSKTGRVGSGLLLQNIRWEQGTNVGGKAAWVFDIARYSGERRVHGITHITMIRCDHAPRLTSTEFNCFWPGGGPNRIGCYLPGDDILPGMEVA